MDVIYFLPFPGWQQLVGFVTSATVLSFGSGPVTMMALRGELPDHKRPFRLGAGRTIPWLAFFSSLPAGRGRDLADAQRGRRGSHLPHDCRIRRTCGHGSGMPG